VLERILPDDLFGGVDGSDIRAVEAAEVRVQGAEDRRGVAPQKSWRVLDLEHDGNGRSARARNARFDDACSGRDRGITHVAHEPTFGSSGQALRGHRHRNVTYDSAAPILVDDREATPLELRASNPDHDVAFPLEANRPSGDRLESDRAATEIDPEDRTRPEAPNDLCENGALLARPAADDRLNLSIRRSELAWRWRVTSSASGDRESGGECDADDESAHVYVVTTRLTPPT
jgi:hypothetical protein